MPITFLDNYYWIMLRQNKERFNRNFMEMVLRNHNELGALFTPDPKALSGAKESITLVYPMGDNDIDQIGTMAGFKTQPAPMNKILEVLKSGECAKVIQFWEGMNYKLRQFDGKEYTDDEIISCEKMENFYEEAISNLGEDSVIQIFVANKKKSWDWLQEYYNHENQFPTEKYLTEQMNKANERFVALDTAIEQNQFDLVLEGEEQEMNQQEAFQERNFEQKRTELFGNCLDQLPKFIKAQTKYNEMKGKYPVKIYKGESLKELHDKEEEILTEPKPPAKPKNKKKAKKEEEVPF